MSSDPSPDQSEWSAAAVRSRPSAGASLAARRSELSAVLNAAAARSTPPVRGHAARTGTELESAHTAEEEEEEECLFVSSLRLRKEKCWISESRDEGAETEERSGAAASAAGASAAAAAAAARGHGHRSRR